MDQQKKAREAGDLGEIEKHGIPTGRFAINPYNGERVPIWVANYILADYGTGAIMSVPGSRPARLRIRREIRAGNSPCDSAGRAGRGRRSLPFLTEDGVLVNSGEYDGLTCAQAQKRLQEVAAQGGFGEAKVTFRLKDWGVSRQRYWGTPIPMIYCEKDGLVQVPDDQLPVLLPPQIEITQQGGSPLSRVPSSSTSPAPNAVNRPCAKPTPWTPSSIPAGTSIAMPTQKTPTRRSTQPSASTGSPSTSTSAAWSTQFST